MGLSSSIGVTSDDAVEAKLAIELADRVDNIWQLNVGRQIGRREYTNRLLWEFGGWDGTRYGQFSLCEDWLSAYWSDNRLQDIVDYAKGAMHSDRKMALE